MDKYTKADMFRQGFGSGGGTSLKMFIKNPSFRYIYSWRKIHNRQFSAFWKFMIRKQNKLCGIEIPYSVDIGPGFLMIHPFNITVNSKAVIGKNCTILKGATIGNQIRGEKAGSPVIGDDVYIGLNATVVGNIHIGNNVLIAPNAYVNFDVPDNTIVIGNPGQCHHSKKATEGYISNRYTGE